MIYQFKSGTHLKSKGVSPQAVGEDLENLRQQQGGKLTAPNVVERAGEPTSPMHSMFTWNDVDAAHQFRLEEARLLLRSMVIVNKDGDEPERAFWAVSVKASEDDKEDRYYQSAAVVSRTPQEYQSALKMMLMELAGAEKGLQQLIKLAPRLEKRKIREASASVRKVHETLAAGAAS